MAFIIANILSQETINDLNERFQLSIRRIKVKPGRLPDNDNFEYFDRLMRNNDEVIYERNTY